MARFLHQFDTFTLRRNRHILLALSWALGLGFGALAFRYGQDRLVSLMPSAVFGRSSIVGLASSLLLPFLFSAFAVYFSTPLLLSVICFVKAFAYAYVSCFITLAFPASGWLIRLLLLFGDQLGIPVLYLYWLRHISGCRGFRAGVTGLFLTLLVLVIAMEYYWISPLFRAVLF